MVIDWLEITGFRSFVATQRLDFTGDLTLVWGPNSQGKTSIAEAIEFLLTGGTVRRELLGGAKAEFEACLRNAHGSQDAAVVVRAGIRDRSGDVHEVIRTLTRDYAADADCDSLLTIDGVRVDDLTSLGIVLADPPLRAPVLLQHSLRFVLSARPQDRSNYFKSVLEIQDLEALRDLVDGSSASVQAPPAPLLSQLRGLRSTSRLGQLAADVEAAKPELIGVKLSEAIDSALGDLGVTLADEGELSARARALLEALESVREYSFPASLYRSAGDVPVALGPIDLTATGTFNDAIESVDMEVSRLVKVFDAVLAVPTIVEAVDAIDCPVCETPAALTPARVAALREEVGAATGLRQAESAARTELSALARRLEAMASSSRGISPKAAALTTDARREHQGIVGDLIGDAQRYEALLVLAAELTEASTALAGAVDQAAGLIRIAAAAIDSGSRVETDAIATNLRDIEPLRSKLEVAHSAYAAGAEALLGPIGEAIDRTQGTADLRALAELATGVDALRSALLDERIRGQVHRELEKALSEIDKAKAAVFDEKFDAMSAEIDTWWQLLRPDEPVRFASVRRRGSGRRFVMFKAHLLGALGEAAIERDALGVFSDSQLNALGLAAFLGRTNLQQAPLVVLDDPLQAGDEEHRATFAGYVIERLLQLGIQVIVLTHDDTTSKLIHHRYEALPVVGFSISLDRPADGSVVIRTTNTAEALLQRAKVYLESDDPEFRSSAAGHLRKAGERIAKEIIVNARKSRSDVCSLADYDESTLGPLITELTPYLTKPDHPGKWKVVGDLLNPGSHDDAPPTKQDLKMAFGYLREALRDYLRSSVGQS
jgi:DNA repair exonuclease SbcCD ATPase subunit